MLINFISDDKVFKKVVEVLKNSKYICVDTESNGLYSYDDKLCLLQIETEGRVYIIDSLKIDIFPLCDIFGNKNIEKIFHSASSDISLIRKVINCDFKNIFDVMIASKYVLKNGFSLKDLVKKYIGVDISKKYQRIDWSKRPLKKEYLEYAAYDVVYLKRIRDEIGKELLKKGVYKQFVKYCEKIAKTPLRKKIFNTYRYYSIAKNYNLNYYQTLLLIELAKKREEIAIEKDIPPFKIASTQHLIYAVKNLDKIVNIDGGRFRWIYEIVKNFKPDFSSKRITDSNNYDLCYKDRIKLLKSWRSKVGEKEEISPELILSKSEIAKIARYEVIDEKICSEAGIDEERIKKYASDLISFYNSWRKA